VGRGRVPSGCDVDITVVVDVDVVGGGVETVVSRGLIFAFVELEQPAKSTQNMSTTVTN